MRKGTFSVRKATSNSTLHNSRINAPKYLIGFQNDEENFYELIKSDEDFINEAKEIYKKKFGQDMQKAYTIKSGKLKGKKVAAQEDNLILETVITLKKSQNENDVKNLFIELNKKFGGHELLEVSVHRDEGHFVKDDIAYYLTKNILKIENEFYICSDVNIEKPKKSDFDKKVDISTFQKVYNYHAHAKFSMFDKKLCKTARMQKKDMSERIKFVSDFLGLDYNPNSKTSRIKKSVNEIKDEHLVKANEKVKAGALDKEIERLRQKLIASRKAQKSDYAELQALKKELKISAKKKELTKDILTKKLNQFKGNLNERTNSTIDYATSIIKDERTRNELCRSITKCNEDIRREHTQNERNIRAEHEFIKSRFKRITETSRSFRRFGAELSRTTETITKASLRNERTLERARQHVKIVELKKLVYHPTLLTTKGNKASYKLLSEYYQSNFDEAENKIKSLENEILDLKKKNQMYLGMNNDLKTSINELQAQKSDLASKVTTLSKIIDSRTFNGDLKTISDYKKDGIELITFDKEKYSEFLNSYEYESYDEDDRKSSRLNYLTDCLKKTKFEIANGFEKDLDRIETKKINRELDNYNIDEIVNSFKM